MIRLYYDKSFLATAKASLIFEGSFPPAWAMSAFPPPPPPVAAAISFIILPALYPLCTTSSVSETRKVTLLPPLEAIDIRIDLVAAVGSKYHAHALVFGFDVVGKAAQLVD